ncbi:MAG TPA: LptF/LptG family permease, partial [Bradyrhizobium sp.]|nr:LptF/LptG family permease [Bradyrhizobium sp.]
MHLARTLSAYIARQFFVWFCGVFGTMVSVTFLLDYIELIRRGGTRAQATWGTLLEMAALKLPHTAQDVMPFAILFGTMLVFWRLTRSNELVVARAAGVSVWGFLAPAILVALLVGVVAVTVFNPIASAMEASYEKLDKRILRQAGDPLSLSHTGLWLRQSDAAGGQIVFHGDKSTAPELLLRNVSVYFLNRLSEFTSRIEARAARLDGGFWVIEDGQRFTPGEPPQSFNELRIATNLTTTKIEEGL